MILEKISNFKKEYLVEVKKQNPINLIMDKISILDKKNDFPFKEALSKKNKMALIAEIKKASPSKGIIREDFDYLKIAKEYIKAEVSAMSILTETEFFKGDNKYLTDIREITNIALLRKDFIIDEYQIYESKAMGADAILLIAALLDRETMKYYFNIAKELGLDCLCETHNESEVLKVLSIGADIIGINNRDLNTFSEDINTTINLMNIIPKDKIIVSESAIRTVEDLKMLKENSINAVLIGEMFMREPDIYNSVNKIGMYL